MLNNTDKQAIRSCDEKKKISDTNSRLCIIMHMLYILFGKKPIYIIIIPIRDNKFY